jgi:hypothetical protein
MSLIFTYKTNGPSSINTNRTILNNGSTNAVHGNPFKPNTMTQGSEFSNARAIYTKDGGGGKRADYSSSDVTYLKKLNAIGKSSKKITLPADAEMTYRSKDNNFKNSRLKKCRSGGCVAPKKKGALNEEQINAIHGDPVLYPKFVAPFLNQSGLPNPLSGSEGFNNLANGLLLNEFWNKGAAGGAGSISDSV